MAALDQNLILAAQFHKEEALNWLLDNDARMTNGKPLNIAGETGSTTMVDILMAGGVDVTLGIPLHKAALSGRFTPGRISMIEHPVSVGYGVNDFHVAAEGLSGKGPPLR